MLHKLPEGDSWIRIYDKLPDELLMTPETFKQLWDLHPVEYGKVKIGGSVIPTPRWQESFGESYYYSGMMHDANPIEHPYMVKVLDWIRKDSGENYRQLLVNWYKDGQHYIGPHSDDTRQLIPNSAIYSFSFGQSRDFVVTSKKDKSFKLTLNLKNNSLIVMGGEMQTYYKHSVPKKAISVAPKPRINITSRLFAVSKN